LAETQSAILPLVPNLDTLRWVFIAVANRPPANATTSSPGLKRATAGAMASLHDDPGQLCSKYRLARTEQF